MVQRAGRAYCKTLLFLSCSILSMASPPGYVPDIKFFPETLFGVVEGERREVTFEVSWEDTNITSYRNVSAEFFISVKSEDPNLIQVNFVDCLTAEQQPKNYTFLVKAVFLGYTEVTVKVFQAESACESNRDHTNFYPQLDDGVVFMFRMPVSVIRAPSVLVNSVTGVFTAFLALNYVNMGVQLDLECIKDVLKKPIGPGIGFVCQFLFMPLASYGIGLIFLKDESQRLGIFTLGSSPGGAMSNFWTLLFHGDVNLSITMTFVSTLAALAMMPFWIFGLGATLFRDRKVTIPYANMASSLILLTIPVGIGLLVQHYSPRLTRLSKKIIKPLTLVFAVIGTTFICVVNRFMFSLFTWNVVLAGLAVAWGGYCFGALVSWMFRLERAQVVAISIETAFQNPAVALVLLLLSMPQPAADLSSIPISAQLMLTAIPMWALLLGISVYGKFRHPSSKSSGVGGVEIAETDAAPPDVITNLMTSPDENEIAVYVSGFTSENSTFEKMKKVKFPLKNVGQRDDIDTVQ